MRLYDVRNQIAKLLTQGKFEFAGRGMSLVEPIADLEMNYLGRRYIITIRDTGASKQEDTPSPEPLAPEDIPFMD